MTNWDRSHRVPGDDLGGLPESSLTTGDRGGASVIDDDPAPSEVFQTLASEVRVRVLVRVLEAEEAGMEPCSFTELQQAAGSDCSAGFAYHLRQLSGDILRQDEEGYSLTPLGRRLAQAIVDGTFTNDGGRAAS